MNDRMFSKDGMVSNIIGDLNEVRQLLKEGHNDIASLKLSMLESTIQASLAPCGNATVLSMVVEQPEVEYINDQHYKFM